MVKDIDFVALGYDKKANVKKKIAYVAGNPLRTAKLAAKSLRRRSEMARMEAKVAEACGVPESDCRFETIYVEHHLAHIASSFYCSPFKRALIVSLEPKSARAIAEVAAHASPWMPVEAVSVQETGGTLSTTARVVELASKLARHLAAAKRVRCELGEITLGTECGGSDTTSGLVSNPVTGMVADRVVDLGGSVIFSETLEIVGAEHLLARRAADPKVARRILQCSRRAVKYAESLGVDLVGSNPAPDNIRGGLSSIEEKSLGAIKKGGSRPIVDVVGVGERPARRGTVFADAPCAGVENLTSLAASGAQAIIFSTGIGNPIGHPIAPTLKVTGNPRTAARMAENVDVDLRGVIEGRMSFKEAVAVLEGELLRVLSGKLTTSELLGETELTVSRAALSL